MKTTKYLIGVAISLWGFVSLQAKDINLGKEQSVLIHCGKNKIDQIIPIQQKAVDGFSCKLRAQKVSKRVTDYHYLFTLESGKATSKAVGVECIFDKWSVDNYVLIPAAAYNGNRFDSYKIAYPPMFYDEAYHKVDLPVTVNDVPRLNKQSGESKLEVETGACTTPAVCIFFPKEKKAVMYLTTQESRFGNHGITVEESEDRKKAVVRFSAPETRESFYRGWHQENRIPKGAQWEAGDQVEIQLQKHVIPCKDINEMFSYFSCHRKDVSGKNTYRNLTPFSSAYRMVTHIQDSLRWYEDAEWQYYRTGNGDSPFGHIQIGFCGEIVKQYPLLWSENPLSIERCAKTFDVIFGRMQGKSGFLYGIFKKGQLLGDNFNDMEKNPDWVLIRKNTDALTYMVKNLMLMEQKGITVHPLWKEGTRKLADAFVTLWERYHQFGQYINPVTGDIIVGGSTAGAYAPAGLALAYQYFGNKKYLETATASAKMYYQRDVKAGYTTGHAAEVLQSPDADSAYALLSSFVTVAEVSGDSDFWKMAEDMANIFSSWVVSYDYRFPKNSTLGKCEARATGAVWASVQNKHAAPGICQYSGDALLKLYRQTGNDVYLELIKDISHNLLEFMSTTIRPVGMAEDGATCERVQMSDWEGGDIGHVIPDHNAWVEEAIMLTAMEIPGIYVRTDIDKICVFDHVEAKIMERSPSGVTLLIANPTKYDASVSILAESAGQTKQTIGFFSYLNTPKVNVKAGEEVKVLVDNKGDVLYL
ncbi:hypothetical protein [uncultured Parabacteroides sp.]|uniref:hypothetical protein n=1 Tax=uncultured Parabacteroides sp. TaxID=512312 RepID=UPI00259AFE54|nr:hypothetical protein [uncultured Parabacteroides sp.]